jgi:glutamate synthase domain-containing protein 3
MAQDHNLENILDRSNYRRCFKKLSIKEQTVRKEYRHSQYSSYCRNNAWPVKLQELQRCEYLLKIPFTINSQDLPVKALGAFATRGMTFELEGDCNDYVGKGLSGGKIIVYPPKNASYLSS